MEYCRGVTARDVGRRLAPYGFPLVVSALLGFFAVRGILDRAGRPALPLDDSFIHLQYARRLVEGGFFSYVKGEGYTSGATSLLWPLLLAPFYAIGLRGLTFVWATWLLGTLAHAALAVETMRIAERLAGKTAGKGALILSLSFGAFAWFAWSGMETIPFAWLLMRTARVSAAYLEPPTSSSDARQVGFVAVAACGFLTPLLRPEGALASGIAMAALLLKPPRQGRKWRFFSLVPLLGPLVVPLLHLTFAHHATSSTTMVKWLPANPAYDRAAASAFIQHNLRLLWESVLEGGDWSAIFVPEHLRLPTLMGLIALVARCFRKRLPAHGAFVLSIVLATALPTTYLSFLWNRVRYVWPFYAAHFVVLACLAREVGGLARALFKTHAPVTPILLGIFAGALGSKLSWTLTDLATSARAIDHQQITLGYWAKENLPESATIGVNDTGAIAYVSERKTFDVVGLTTEGEARYWAHGAGARFEHYEKLQAEKRPSHFIVYPEWMACRPVLGEELHRATVTDQSILGGQTMVAYEARWDLLGSGALPKTVDLSGLRLVDELDVADLESEAEHGYMLFGGSDQDCVVYEQDDVADGGRLRRGRERFLAKLPDGRPVKLILRASADVPVALVIRAGGIEVGTADVGEFGWTERRIEIPGDRVREKTEIEITPKDAGATFNIFHVWLYE